MIWIFLYSASKESRKHIMNLSKLSINTVSSKMLEATNYLIYVYRRTHNLLAETITLTRLVEPRWPDSEAGISVFLVK